VLQGLGFRQAAISMLSFQASCLTGAAPEYVRKLAASVDALKLLPLDKPGEMVTLPVAYPNIGDKLYVRPSYVKLYNYLEGNRQADPRYKGAVVSGNPGIGKSFFAHYVLLR